jgi:hypothetical protein
MFKGKKKQGVLKNGVPKARDLKDYEAIISLTVDDIDLLEKALAAAVPEIGRQMAKANGWNSASNMKVLTVATSLNGAINALGCRQYHEQAREYALFNKYDSTSWNATDKCGNATRNDFQDLYESPEYEVIIRATSKLKDRNELGKRGVK